MKRRLRTALGTAWAGLMVYGIFLIVVRRLAGVPKLPDKIGVPVLILCFFPGWLAFRWIERQSSGEKDWRRELRGGAAVAYLITFLVTGLLVATLAGFLFGVGPLADLLK